VNYSLFQSLACVLSLRHSSASVGSRLTPAGTFDFKGKYKYDAWKKLEGMTKEDAMAKYVELLKGMLEKGDDEDSKKYLAELEGGFAIPMTVVGHQLTCSGWSVMHRSCPS
jgi:hypothetical protein